MSERLFVILAVMSATLIQVLDTTIVNVALPHMAGALGATIDQTTWVLTSYLIASAIVMPLTGYFSDVFGRKRYLLVCIGGFVIASALCGISRNLFQIVSFRLLQGAFGAGLVPLSQAIMADAFPVEERGEAMAIWGLGVMVGPVLGPTLGGWLTQIASWRWTFYINLPVGALSLFLAMQFVHETPTRERRMDWIGLALMAAGIGALQYVLDRGNSVDWFSSAAIRAAAAVSVAGLIGFLWWSLHAKREAVFDLTIFKDRNFATSCLLMAALGVALFGGLVVQPILIEGLLNYPTFTTGLVMAPRGLASAVAMIIVGRLVSKVDTRLLIGTGIVLGAVASHAMTRYSLDVNNFWLIWPAAVQGLGMGLIFVPLSTIAYATLDRSRTAEGAGLFSLLRTVGSAIGISFITTLMTRRSEALWQQLGGAIRVTNPALREYLSSLHLAPTDPKAIALVAQEVGRQAQMIGMLDAFEAIALSFVAMLPLLLLMRRRKGGAGPSPPPAMD